MPAADQALAILAHLAAQRGPVPAATIAHALGLPVKLVGGGVGIEHLRPYNPRVFAPALGES